MNKINAKLLRQISDRLKSQDGEELWAVLAALRGPDSGNDNLKLATTGIVRRKVYGARLKDDTVSYENGAGYYTSVGGLVTFKDNKHLVSIRKSFYPNRTDLNDFREDHFIRHVVEAFEALDLKWNKINKL